MFGKIIDLIVKWICSSSHDSEKYRTKSGRYTAQEKSIENNRLNINEHIRLPPATTPAIREHIDKPKSAKPAPTMPAKKYSDIFGAFHYMNVRAQEVNFGTSVTHEWVRGISLKVKDFCTRPQVAIVLFALPLLYLVSPKAVVLVPLLVVLGAVALVAQSYLPIYIGLDFSLMGAVLGSVLFHPWIGVLIVFCTYVLAVMFPNGNQDALEYERIFLFSFLALIIPYIPVADIMLKCIVATYIGEFLEMIWHKYGEDYPWPMAFLKVFPRSLIYIYIFHYTLKFLV